MNVRRHVLVLVGVGIFTLAACNDGPTRRVSDKGPPYTKGIEVGHTYDYSLTTHCGINQAMIDGTWWKASPPLSDRNGNPPEGWPNPPATGHLEIVAKNKAVFMTEDLSASFVRADLEPIGCA